jgi:hypothetical protein
MSNRTETVPSIARSANASIWKPPLFRAAYIIACAIAMFGWAVALSWATLSFLRLVVSQFT